MNKIIIENDYIIKSEIDYKLKEKENKFAINELIFNIDDNNTVLMNINIKEESKLMITFNVASTNIFNLIIITKGSKGKIQYKYNLEKKSVCNVEKLNLIDSIREMIITNLEENSKFKYVFKSVANGKENYDYMIYHNGVNSLSDVVNNSINESGSIYYQISSFIPKNIVGCSANQFNRIINKTNNKCEIKPNLYIECADTIANHSALIDKFNQNELFYLYLKGINNEEADKLLTRGFLLNKITNKEIIDIINKKYGGE